MAPRYGISIGIAIAITFGLLFVMQLLIATGRGSTESRPPIRMPRYPVPAQRAGIQGYAVVEYTVTTAGTTRDIRLAESSNPIFDRSCVEAAEKFRYRPRFVNGEAIEVPGVRNRCVYRLDE